MIILLLLLLSSLEWTEPRPVGLYGDGRDIGVVILNETNFDQFLLGDEDHAWLVEFYASWCGHCQKFAPTFSEVARQMRGWGEVLSVGVVDCGDQKINQEICSKADILGFPTIKWYRANRTNPEDTGVNRVATDLNDVTMHSKEAIVHDTIDFIENMIDDDNNMTKEWPDLKAINVNNNISNITLEDLWPGDKDDTFLVVESPTSYLGRELVMTTWSRDNLDHPVVRRVVTTGGSQVMDQVFGVKGDNIPGVVVLNRDQQSVTALKVVTGQEENVVDGWMRSINNYLANKSLRNSDNFRRTSSSTTERVEEVTKVILMEDVKGNTSTTERVEVVTEVTSIEDIRRRRYSVFLSDLEKTVLFALINEVGLNSVIETGDKQTALRQFVSVLVKFFPHQSQIVSLLDSVSHWLDRQKGSLDIRLMIDILSPMSGEYSDIEWVGCRGSTARYGGYTCGLWMVWHQMTVAQHEFAVGEMGEVLQAMVGYVRHYFGCRECATHFLDMVEGGNLVNTSE